MFSARQIGIKEMGLGLRIFAEFPILLAIIQSCFKSLTMLIKRFTTFIKQAINIPPVFCINSHVESISQMRVHWKKAELIKLLPHLCQLISASENNYMLQSMTKRMWTPDH